LEKRLKQSTEGLVIIALGVFLLVNSLRIAENPIAYEGWTNIIAQAKFTPLVMSLGITILGLILFVKQYRGKDTSSGQMPKEEWIHLLICLALIAIYIFCVYWFKFMVPTIVFSFAMFSFLNWKTRKKTVIFLSAALAIALGLYGLPLLISLRLPLF
jgi:uncharacterized membrane protein